VPLSVPGLKRRIGSAGQEGSMSDQLVASCEKILASCSMVTSVRKSLAGLTTTASPSVPTRNSTGSRPMARQFSRSESLIGRLAFEMSVSPDLQKRSKPAPVPMLSIVMLPANPSSWKRSAIASVSGYTVELPAMMMSPLTARGSTGGSSPAGASAAGASAAGASAAGASGAEVGVGSAAAGAAGCSAG